MAWEWLEFIKQFWLYVPLEKISAFNGVIFNTHLCPTLFYGNAYNKGKYSDYKDKWMRNMGQRKMLVE